jgi:hypothetical protein
MDIGQFPYGKLYLFGRRAVARIGGGNKHDQASVGTEI